MDGDSKQRDIFVDNYRCSQRGSLQKTREITTRAAD